MAPSIHHSPLCVRGCGLRLAPHAPYTTRNAVHPTLPRPPRTPRTPTLPFRRSISDTLGVKRTYRIVLLLGVLLMLPLLAVAAADPAGSAVHGAEPSHSLEHRMTMLALEIGIILFAGYIGARIARRLGVPIILGELVAGIAIGPYLLGSIPLPGYPQGVFPQVANALSISPELYGFAVVASIVLLFLMGLQTDIRLFLRFAYKGSVVGLSGAVFSVAAGITVGMLLLGVPATDSRVLFLGVVAIATSVDITGRILSERHKMASPEGVTILSAAVIEDVVGITMLAVVLGIDAMRAAGETGSLVGEIFSIAGRALGVWLGFTTLGIVFSRRISALLKGVKNPAQIAVLSLGLALILAGLFEAAGLAMIIGAYVMGLSLANTDIAYVVQEKIETVHQFFDPIFFTVTGMLVNVFVLASGEVILFGLLFGILAVASKVVGCGVPSLALGFTRAGATRIAVGMVPRGEVALVIASIGIGSGILDDRLFGITIFMTLFTTLSGPPIFNWLMQREARVTREAITDSATVTTDFDFGSEDLNRFLLSDVITMMRGEGFFVNASEGEHRIYHMRKESVFIAMHASETALHFVSQKGDLPLVNNLVYEAVLSLQQRVSHIRTISKPSELRRVAATVADDDGASAKTGLDWYRYLPVECVHLSLNVPHHRLSGTERGETGVGTAERSAADGAPAQVAAAQTSAVQKEAVIRTLVWSLADAGKVTDREAVLEAVLERERSMSTGMQHGIAIPHGRAAASTELAVAVGLVPDGMEFGSLDGEPTQIIFLVVSPKENPGPHLQVLAGIAAIGNSPDARAEMLAAPTRADLIEVMTRYSSARSKARA